MMKVSFRKNPVVPRVTSNFSLGIQFGRTIVEGLFVLFDEATDSNSNNVSMWRDMICCLLPNRFFNVSMASA